MVISNKPEVLLWIHKYITIDQKNDENKQEYLNIENDLINFLGKEKLQELVKGKSSLQILIREFPFSEIFLQHDEIEVQKIINKIIYFGRVTSAIEESTKRTEKTEKTPSAQEKEPEEKEILEETKSRRDSEKKSDGEDAPISIKEIINALISGKKEFIGKNMSGLDLRRIEFPKNPNFSKADMTSVNLEGVTIESPKFTRTKLNYAKLNNAILESADFRLAKLWYANLNGTNLKNARLNDAELFDAHLEGADLSGANLTNAGLMSANLSGTILEGTDLSNANLKYAKFNQDTDFRNSIINNVTLDNLEGSNWEIGKWDEDTKNSLQKNYGKELNSGLAGEFVLIAAGEFMMGSPESEIDRFDDEGPVQKVTIKNPFYIGKYPVTQKQWIAVMGNNPSQLKGEDRPVESVSWNDAQEFIKKLNHLEKTDKYRLPFEAEWEYACRAGTKTRYSFGDDKSKLGDYAWYGENAGSETHSVGLKKPNPWGLYDMHGNVWEWCQDKYHDSYSVAPSDGSAWDSGSSSHSVYRGGSWHRDARYCRSALRLKSDPDDRDGDLGFRVLRTL